MGGTFRLESYRTLKKRLGDYDNIVEMNELSVRKFLYDIKGNEAHAIKEASKAHGVRVDFNENLDDVNFTARRAQFYILSVYQQAEQFFDDLMNDLPQGTEWKTATGSAREKDEAQLTWIARMIAKHTSVTLSEEFTVLMQMFHYFRLARNAFMHEGKETRELRKCLAKLTTILKERKPEDIDSSTFPIHLPNCYDKLDFSDFLYFTRIVKEIAQNLCEILKPDLEELLKHTFTKEQHHGLRQYIGNDERFATACGTLLERKFNFSEVDVQYAIPIIKGLI